MAEFTPGVKIATEYTLADRWSKSAEKVIEDGQLRMWSPEEHHGADCHCDDCYSVRGRGAIASAETAPAAEVQEAPDQAASHAFAGGRTLPEVRDAAGHSNVSITSVYLHVAVETIEPPGNLLELLFS